MVPYSRVLTKVKPVTSTAIPSPVPELSFLPEPGRAKRESRITCMRTLKTNQIDMCFIVVCTLIDNDYASIIFSQTFFRVLSAF